MSDLLHHSHGAFSGVAYWKWEGLDVAKPMNRLWHWLDHYMHGQHQADRAETTKFVACQLGSLQAIAERLSLDGPGWESVAARIGEAIGAVEDCQ